MRFANVPGYSSAYPVNYSNMYQDYSMTTAGFADPFQPQMKEQHSPCSYVVGYNGSNDPRYQLNNPAYMREVDRSATDAVPPVILNKRPIQNRF